MWRASDDSGNVPPHVVVELLPIGRAAKEVLEEHHVAGVGIPAPARIDRVVAAVEERARGEAGRGLGLEVEPIPFRVGHVGRVGPGLGRFLVGRTDVAVDVVEEPASEVDVSDHSPVGRFVESELVEFLVDRVAFERVAAKAERLLGCPVEAVVALRVPPVLAAPVVDLAVDEHLLLARADRAGDERRDPRGVGGAMIGSDVTGNPEPRSAGRVVGDDGRDCDHPSLVIVWGGRRGRRLATKVTNQVEQILGRRAGARAGRVPAWTGRSTIASFLSS